MCVFAYARSAGAVFRRAGPTALIAVTLAALAFVPAARSADIYDYDRYGERSYEYSAPAYPRPYADYARPREYRVVPAPRPGERVYEDDRYVAPAYPNAYWRRYDRAPAYGANGYDDRAYAQGYRDGYDDGRHGGGRREFEFDALRPPAPIIPRRGPIAYAPPYGWD